jgi:ubiquinone/menaquinone biosynthesis C-methylase UbiE
MESIKQNSYEGTGPANAEIIRLKEDDLWSQQTSKTLVGEIKENERLIDIGAGSSTEFGHWVRKLGGRYLAVDISSEMLASRIFGDKKLYGNKEASADDLSDIQDKQFDYSHMKLVLMHLDQEKRKKAISEALRVSKKKSFFLDADWSGWGGTKTVTDFVDFVQGEINKYRVIDNFIGQKIEKEIREVADALGYKVTRVIKFKQEAGNHYHYLIDLAKGSYFKIIKERVENKDEQERLLGILNVFIQKLEKEAEEGIPIEMATLTAVEVSLEKDFKGENFDWANEDDIQEIINIEEDTKLEKLLQTENKESIEKSGFLIHPLKEEDLRELIKNKKDAKVIVYRKNGKAIGYVIGCRREFWKKLKPEWLGKLKPLDNFDEKYLSDNCVHIMLAISKDAVRGVGAKLSLEIIRQYSKMNPQILIGKILKEPYQNIASKEMHTRMGFQEVAELEEFSNGQRYLWSLFMKELDK